jgi:hypothetical protein
MNAMTLIKCAAKFAVGQIVITRGANSELSQKDMLRGLIRHMNGDWGELDEHDWKENDAALEYGFRILSQYQLDGGSKFWIITEHDRSVTTVLLPSEY